jgi:hypothetical protein
MGLFLLVLDKTSAHFQELLLLLLVVDRLYLKFLLEGGDLPNRNGLISDEVHPVVNAGCLRNITCIDINQRSDFADANIYLLDQFLIDPRFELLQLDLDVNQHAQHILKYIILHLYINPIYYLLAYK